MYNKIPLNLKYFNEIDSHDKAYFLGLIASDGSIVKSRKQYQLTISLLESDRNVLEELSKKIGYVDRPLSIINSKKYKPNVYYNCRNQVRFTCGHFEITNTLIELGIVPNKSLILKNILINIPKNYRKSFILGYFDGDGSIVVGKPYFKKRISSKTGEFLYYKGIRPNILSIRGTTDILKGICDEMQWEYNHIRYYDSIPRLDISKKQQLKDFFDIYEYNNVFFTRKYNKFLQIFNQVQTISSS